MRCKYCHNREFLEQKDNFIPEGDVIKFLETRVGMLDGVVLSGGECTLDADFIAFIEKVKKLGFKIKVDTNGLIYDNIKQIVQDRLVDFVALDFKATRKNFSNVTQVNENLYDNFEKTLKLLINEANKNSLDLEIRTTVHTILLGEKDINEIIDILDELKYSKIYHIQNFRNDNKPTLVELGNQQHLLDKSKIKKPTNFRVEYRNFFHGNS
jgi:pyruvate formate lyase activating enzyme